MKEFSDLSIQIITIDLFIGFGLFSFFYVLITFFKKDLGFLETLDSKAVRFIAFTGLVYFTLIVLVTTYSFSTTQNTLIRGQYWWAPWLQPLLWIALTQLFRIKKVKNLKLLRIFIAILLIVSFERFVIIVTSFHRDHVQGISTMFSTLTGSEIMLGLAAKVIVFCLLAIAYSFISDNLIKLRG